MGEFAGFPSPADTPWPGAWHYGVDYSGDAESVVAIRFGDGDIKYGIDWVGPIDLNDCTAKLLAAWAEYVLWQGGYVHLFPAGVDECGRSRVDLIERLKNFNDIED